MWNKVSVGCPLDYVQRKNIFVRHNTKSLVRRRHFRNDVQIDRVCGARAKQMNSYISMHKKI